jgi:hypothetical protein
VQFGPVSPDDALILPKGSNLQRAGLLYGPVVAKHQQFAISRAAAGIFTA